LGQNLNFAASSNEVLALLDTASRAKPLNADEKEPILPNGHIWTSLTSGRDYRVRLDGDYIYTEWTNIPAALQGTAAFGRGELNKSGAIWTGHFHSSVPCTYYDQWWLQQRTNWITFDLSMEISSVSGSRIVGRTQNYTEGFDCKKKTPKGKPSWTSFTWIPKEQ